MKIKTFCGWILKTPLILINIATLGVLIYAATGSIPGFLISWGAPCFYASLQAAYLIGTLLIYSARKNKEESIGSDNYEEQSN
jgi:hypothetical protein